MNKRGQITLFVIVAVLIIAAIVLVYVFQPQLLGIKMSPEEAQKLVTSQTQSVRDYTEICMEHSTMKLLNTMGRQGGYVLPPMNRFAIPLPIAGAPIMSYALFYHPERGYINEFPSIEEMKDELVDYLTVNPEFLSCIDEYSPYEKIIDVKIVDALTIDRVNIEFGEESGSLIVPYSYPVEISKGNASALIEDYELILPINLIRIREMAARVINSISAGQNYMEVLSEESEIEWDQMREDANNEKMFVRAEAFSYIPSEAAGNVYNEKNLIFTIAYENKGLEDPFEFSFLVGSP